MITVTVIPIAHAGSRDCAYCAGLAELPIEPDEDGPHAEPCYVCAGTGLATRCGCCAVAGASDDTDIAAAWELRARDAAGREHWRRVCFRDECTGEALGELRRAVLGVAPGLPAGGSDSEELSELDCPWTFGLCGGLVL